MPESYVVDSANVQMDAADITALETALGGGGGLSIGTITTDLTTPGTYLTSLKTVLQAKGATGTFTLNGSSTVAVANANVTANSVIHYSMKTPGGTPGAFPSFVSSTPTTGFSVAGTALDTSVYNYVIFN